MVMVANDYIGTELARPTAFVLSLIVNQSPFTPSQQWKGAKVMSKASDKLEAIQVWSKPEPNPKGWDEVDGIKLPPITWTEPQPVVIPQVILDVLTAKPKPTRKPRK